MKSRPDPLFQLCLRRIKVVTDKVRWKDFEENWAELEWLVGQEYPRPPGGKK
jgi:hypothetical protein